jgi:general secretion pathway protein N
MLPREDPTAWRPAPWRWAAAGAVLGLLVSVLLFLPATWLAAAVRDASGGRVVLADARGTAWNGSAQLLLTGGAGSRDASALPGRINWKLRPRLHGLQLELALACCIRDKLALSLRPRWGGATLVVADSASAWPAALLSGLGTPWNTLQIDGNLHLVTQALSVEWIEGRLAVAGQAQLVAQGISSRLSTLRPMGSYRITLQGGATPTLQLETLDGSLRLAGSGQWVGSRLRFNGEASAAPEREAALSNLLNIIGRRSGARSLITIG